jgi:dolichol kinase
MSPSFINMIILAGAFLALFATAELLYHKFKVKAEITRKFVHLMTGLLTMFFPPMLDGHWFVMALCGSFLFILVGSMIFNLLPSINAVDRVTRGSLLYPIVVYFCFLAFLHFDQFVFYYIPILILAICDPIAALTGKRWPIGKYTIFGQSKTMLGSSMFMLSAVITCFLLLILVDHVAIGTALVLSLVVAFATTLLEAISHKGYDNLTIPAAAMGVLLLAKSYFSLF